MHQNRGHEGQFRFDHFLHFSDFENVQLGQVRQTPCIRIGVMKDNFVFDHILQFSDYTRVQLG